MTGEAVTVILASLLVVGLAHDENCATLGLLASNPASSCNEIYQRNIASKGNNGHYWINTTQGLHEVKCKMGLQCGGVEGGWMQVIDVNMAHDNSCPGAWRMITSPRKLCVGGDVTLLISTLEVYAFSTSVAKPNLTRKELLMHLGE